MSGRLGGSAALTRWLAVAICLAAIPIVASGCPTVTVTPPSPEPRGEVGGVILDAAAVPVAGQMVALWYDPTGNGTNLVDTGYRHVTQAGGLYDLCFKRAGFAVAATDNLQHFVVKLEPPAPDVQGTLECQASQTQAWCTAPQVDLQIP